MIAVGEALRERFGNLGTEREGVPLPAIEHGMPIDRTICPHCLGRDELSRNCHVCKGEAVCPTCRSGRVLSVAGRDLRYIVCPDCCYDADQRTQTGVPMWSDNPEGRNQAIRRYQLARWREQESVVAGKEWSVDDVPFDD